MDIVDALVLTIGLDASKFVKGQKEVAQSLKKTKETSIADGKAIETSMTAASAGVGKLVAAFLGLTAVFTGGKAVKEFMTDVTKTDASLGRFANNLRMSTKDLQSWQGAVESVGGVASDVTSSVQGLSDSFQALKTFGDPGIVKALAVIGTKGGKRIDINKPINSTLLDLADDLSKIAKTDPAQASYLGRQIGLNQNLINVLIKGRAETEKLLAIQAKYAASTADIDAAEKRQSAWQRLQAAGESFGRTILTAVTPALLKLNELLRQFVEWAKGQLPALQKYFEDTFGTFDEILKRISDTLKGIDWKAFAAGVKAFGGDVKGAAEWVNNIVTGTIGWKTALEALIGLKVLGWLIPVAAQFGLIQAAMASIVGLGPALAAVLAGAGVGWVMNKLFPDKALPGQPGNPVKPDNPARPNYYPHGPSVHQREQLPRPQGHPGTDGGPIEHSAPIGGGGSRSWRNNNPGNIEYGPFARSHGAIGSDGRFAVFPDDATGTSAQRSLLFELEAYKNLSVAQAISKWAPGSENNVPAYVKAVTGGGITANSKMSDFSKEQQDQFMAAMRAHEGWTPGDVAARDRSIANLKGDIAQGAAKSPLASIPHPRRYQGKMRIGDETFDYASGSENRGRGSSPFGSHPILGFDRSALGGRGGGASRTRDVYDPRVHDKRGAVEIHMSNDVNRIETHGCFGIPRLQWPRAKAALQKYLKEHPGGATLMVSPNGEASIVPRGGLRYGPHSVAPENFSRPQSFIPPVGAATSAHVAHHNSSTVNHNNASHEVHVGNVNVHTAATDASGIVRDIKPALERASYASLGNYSLA